MKQLIVVVFACALSACGARNGDVAMSVERSVRTTVVSASTVVEPLVCGAEARQVLGSAPCLTFLDVLEPTVNLAIDYNLALQAGKTPPIAQMVTGITALIDAIRQLVPASAARDQAIHDLTTARVQAQGGT